MDGIDFRILAALHEDGLLSQAAIGRRVGLTAPAVASRLAKLERGGILRGFRADVHPCVFGRDSTMHVFPGPFNEADMRRALSLGNVIWAAWKIDDSLTVMTYGKADLEILGDAIETMPGEPRPAAEPSRLARRVLAGVVQQPRAGRDGLARNTGLSPKTCAKHRDGAIEAGHLSIRPILGALRGEGAIVYHAAIFNPSSEQNVRAALQQAVLVNKARGVQYWFCMAPDFATAMQRQKDVETLGAEVHITMNRQLIQNDDRLIAWLSNDGRQADHRKSDDPPVM